tara:strand:- start:39 stop:1334 length:1296 start_codon:yes stop_codon:yes gene_type:complete
MNKEYSIKIKNLSKKYRLGVIGSGMLSNDINNWWRGLQIKFNGGKNIVNKHKSNFKDIWALRDINLKIEVGEVVGIIGKNGAGKSTLLKILSQITSPTTGQAILNGRVGSLLEVGTGFHPELTGKENVYLNGSILGMRKIEIDKSYEEIVEFSGVGDYINTPIKRYSSGMNVRLAFAVAAFLNTDILIVDEVLAVGDYEFQNKCLNKLDKIANRGKTVLMVSHNMSSVSKLCPRTILLDKGKLICEGNTDKIIDRYLSGGKSVNSKVFFDINSSSKNKEIALQSIRALDESNNSKEIFKITEDVIIECQFHILKEGQEYTPSMSLKDEKGILIFHAVDANEIWFKPRKTGKYISSVKIPKNLLRPGKFYYSQLVSTIHHSRSIKHIHKENAISFIIIDTWDGHSAMGHLNTDYLEGAIRPKLEWNQELIQK